VGVCGSQSEFSASFVCKLAASFWDHTLDPSDACAGFAFASSRNYNQSSLSSVYLSASDQNQLQSILYYLEDPSFPSFPLIGNQPVSQAARKNYPI